MNTKKTNDDREEERVMSVEEKEGMRDELERDVGEMTNQIDLLSKRLKTVEESNQQALTQANEEEERRVQRARKEWSSQEKIMFGREFERNSKEIRKKAAADMEPKLQHLLDDQRAELRQLREDYEAEMRRDVQEYVDKLSMDREERVREEQNRWEKMLNEMETSHLTTIETLEADQQRDITKVCSF